MALMGCGIGKKSAIGVARSQRMTDTVIAPSTRIEP
jgi:hypothetical protein